MALTINDFIHAALSPPSFFNTPLHYIEQTFPTVSFFRPDNIYRSFRARIGAANEGFISELRDRTEISLLLDKYHHEEITVKTDEVGDVIVEAKHDRSRDEDGGFTERRFVRKFVLAKKGHVMGKTFAYISRHGVLTVTVPKTDALESIPRDTPIPVVHLSGISSLSSE